MKSHILRAIDARQTPQWSAYLKSLGWNIETSRSLQIAIKKLPFFNCSFIKILHPIGPLPFNLIDSISKKYKAVWTVIEPHAYKFDEDSFNAHGYVHASVFHAHTATIKIDLLQHESDLFHSFSENAKRNIRKAEKNNLKIKTISMKRKRNWKYFDLFYELLSNLGRMKHFYVPSKDEYKKKMMAFLDSSILLFAYKGEVPVAVVWYVSFKNVFAYFQTGITNQGYETLANYLLVWRGLLYAKKNKLTVFDFESIYDERFPKNVPRYKNYTEFKKRFHGQLILYPQPYIKFYSYFGKLFYLLGTLS